MFSGYPVSLFHLKRNLHDDAFDWRGRGRGLCLVLPLHSAAPEALASAVIDFAFPEGEVYQKKGICLLDRKFPKAESSQLVARRSADFDNAGTRCHEEDCIF